MKPWWQRQGRVAKVFLSIAAFFLLVVLLEGIFPGIKQQATTTVTTTAPSASVGCGAGTSLQGSECIALAPRTRTIIRYRTRTVTVTTPAAVSSPPAPPAPAAPPTQSAEGPGSYSHADDTTFCSTNQCIGSFTTEPGYIVMCSDGTYSHSGGISGSCSRHGGNA